MSYSLKDIRPSLGTFKLEATGDSIHTFRKFCIDDEEWVKETFGKSLDDLLQPGAKTTASILSRIMFHQLIDKTPFKKRTVTEVDDETGEEKERMLVPWRSFMKAIDNDEFLDISQAFVKSIVGSRPMPKITAEPAEKKTAEKSVGPKSLISSGTNTDAPSTSSLP